METRGRTVGCLNQKEKATPAAANKTAKTVPAISILGVRVFWGGGNPAGRIRVDTCLFLLRTSTKRNASSEAAQKPRRTDTTVHREALWSQRIIAINAMHRYQPAFLITSQNALPRISARVRLNRPF